MYWDFDCKIGASSDIAEAIRYEELIKTLDKIKSMGVNEVYMEIIAKEVDKPLKPSEDEEENDSINTRLIVCT